MAKHPPAISVVTIFFNAERFLNEAIESVLGQTYDHWELILVDDGSTDKSTEIAVSYASLHPERVRYLEHPSHQNLGMSVSRNSGMAMARGDYIAFLDSDDVWFPNKLEDQIRILQSHPGVMMVYGNHQFWKTWDRGSDEKDYQLEPGIEVNRIFSPPELLLLYFQPVKAAMPIPSDLLLSREMGMKHGGFEPQFRSMYEDHPFLLKVFAHEPVFVSNLCWTRYRQHEQSSVALSRQKNSRESLLALLEWTHNYLASSGFAGTKPWNVAKKALFRIRHPFLFRLAAKLRVFR